MNISLNFKKQFAPDVRVGKKRQTIRLRGKRQAQVGDKLYLFTGLRTKFCERLGNADCLMAEPFEIDTRSSVILVRSDQLVRMGMLPDIAVLDGFTTVDAFFDFFKAQYGEGKLEVVLYRW